jgi:epsilon-lactone hydrolase
MAIDYRLMPEFSREAAINDCQAAYRWLLDHSSEGEKSVDFYGDRRRFGRRKPGAGSFSLGRDSDLRKPDAVVACLR